MEAIRRIADNRHSFDEPEKVDRVLGALYVRQGDVAKAEAAFKSVARALREAVEPDPRRSDAIPSTKGAL